MVLTFGPTVRRTARQAIFPMADVKSCLRAHRCYFISLKVTRVHAEDVAASAASALMRGKHVHPFLLQSSYCPLAEKRKGADWLSAFYNGSLHHLAGVAGYISATSSRVLQFFNILQAENT